MGKNINTSGNMSLLCGGLFGKTRQSVLFLIYGRTDGSFYTLQIMDTVKSGRGAVQTELKNLTNAGIILREARGRQVYYRANEQCPIFSELKNLVEKMQRICGNDRLDELYIQHRFNIPKKQLIDFCRKHHIKKLSLFGSILKPDFRPDSDIDILVEFENGFVPGFGIIAMQNELSKMAGRKIDLRTAADLSRYFRAEVIREAKVQYEHPRT